MGIFNRNQAQEIPSVTAVPALVDTSVIIDGRIVDIAKAGFAPGKLLVPRFVLAELQLISDSGDSMKRSKGRRGLEMLHTMREIGVDLDIIEEDYSDIKEVDAKLVRLGRKLGCNVLTTDYNLNRVASIEGVRVLNINELANAVRPVILPGEHMHTRIVQPGKERGQGVGYLADGTMIVVDSADKLIGQDVQVEITRVFQTVAGKMLFAVLAANTKTPKPDHRSDRSISRNTAPEAQPAPKPKQVRSSRQGNGGKPQDGVKRGSGRSQKNGQNAGASTSSRPKRMSPTQRLENSLVELTSAPPEDSPR